MKLLTSLYGILIYYIMNFYGTRTMHLRKPFTSDYKKNSSLIYSEMNQIISTYNSMKNEVNEIALKLNHMRDTGKNFTDGKSKKSLPEVNQILTKKLTEKEKKFGFIIGDSVKLLNSFSDDIDAKIKNLEKTINKNQKIKRKTKHYDSSLIFYNSLSMIMLSLLGGGLVGVILILYFSFKHSVKHNIDFD